MLENKNLESYPFEDKLLDLSKLEIGKVYPSFDDGKFKPSRLCFIKIKEITDTGYIVDVEWDKEIVARDQEMILKDHFYYDVPVLKSTKDYGGIISPDIYKLINSLWICGLLTEEQVKPSILK